MGLFSFIGKAAKAVGGLIGGPVGGVLKLGGGLLDHKAQSPISGVKYPTISSMGTQAARGKPSGATPTFFPTRYGNTTQAMPTPRQVLSESPVLPGGAVATRSGPTPQTSAVPPRSFGGSGRGHSGKRTKRSATHSAGTRKKRGSGRKLKFGSPAWRAKYLGKKKRKR